MASDGEFDFIRTRLGPLTRGHRAALGLSDDAALLDPPPGCEIVLASDMLVAGVHFLDSDTPETAATRILGANLSDLAAMGAEPLGYLASIAWPRDTDSDWRDRFVAALADMQDGFRLALIGGDTTVTPGPFTVSMTLVGSVPKGEALLRSGARAGDHVWVSGTIGDATLGLDIAAGRASGPDALRTRYERPEPRLDLGEGLRGIASAAIDISDGLIADAGHIAQTSGVALRIEAEAIPLSAEARAWLETAGEGGLVRLVTGGDDYELVFTAPEDRRDAILALAAELRLELTWIGDVVQGEGVSLLDAGGRDITPARQGFTHF